jgi:hypothetical protein
MSAPLPGDKRAGFIGLVVAAVFILWLVTLVVYLTNAKYAHREGAPAAAATR